jgi:hypothetical protein
MTESGLPRDDELEGFVRDYLVSFAAWDMLVLLHAQPDLADSLSGLAFRLGRAERDVREASRAMIEGGLLVPMAGEEQDVFGVTSDPHMLELLERFVEASSERDWRLDLVRRVLNRLV